MVDDATLIIESGLRLATPLLFVALGELIAERSGALNISVEAMMLGGAFSGVLAVHLTDQTVLGLFVGVATGLLIASIQAVLSHRITINQFIVGLALNLLVLGTTSFLLAEFQLEARHMETIRIPLLADIPVVGTGLFEQPGPFYLLYVLVPLTWWVLKRTRWGLEIRAVGENPDAATVTGLSVKRRRRQAVYVCGAFAGLGGAYLSVGLIGTFTPNMTSGRGFIAIAAVILGGWTVRGTVIGCLIFGGADALRLSLPAIGLELNPQLLIASPYLLALLVMLVFAQGQRQPAALGRDYREFRA